MSNAVATCPSRDPMDTTHESPGSTWISYSNMDTTKYNGLITLMALTSSFILQPFNVVATRQQAGSLVTGDKGSSRTVVEALSQYRKELGWRGLFRGYLPIATMGVPSQIVYLSITETTREVLQKNIRTVFPGFSSGLIDAAQSSATALAANIVSLIPYVPADVISSRMVGTTLPNTTPYLICLNSTSVRFPHHHTYINRLVAPLSNSCCCHRHYCFAGNTT